VAIVFGASGYFHLKDPVGRAKSVELSPRATMGLGDTATDKITQLGRLRPRRSISWVFQPVSTERTRSMSALPPRPS
jgi:hypothetical protein